MNYCNFDLSNSVVDTKSNIIQMRPTTLNVGQKINLFRLLRIPSLILKDQREDIICTMALSKDLCAAISVPGKQWNLSRWMFFFS